MKTWIEKQKALIDFTLLSLARRKLKNLGLLLFVFNADKMAVMFVGAMCAVGTLNANAFGFPALIAQIVVFFLAASLAGGQLCR